MLTLSAAISNFRFSRLLGESFDSFQVGGRRPEHLRALVEALQDLNGRDLAHDTYDLFESSVIATNVSSGNLPKVPTEQHPNVKAWTHASFNQDFTRRNLEKKMAPEDAEALANAQAHASTNKQERVHTKLTGVVGRLLGGATPHGHPEGYHVVSPGSGMGHEQVFKHPDLALQPHRMVGLEFQNELTDLADHRNKGFGIHNASNHQWSIYDTSGLGDTKQQIAELDKIGHAPVDKVHPDWEKRLAVGYNGLPSGEHNVGYAKHACGGLTDLTLKKAVDSNWDGFVAQTCCSHRYAGISHKIIGEHHKMPWEEWQKLVEASSHNEEPDVARAAQLKIDELRKKYLEDHGYSVRHEWTVGPDGKPDPKGGLLVAARKGGPLHGNVQRTDMFKDMTLHPDAQAELASVNERGLPMSKSEIAKAARQAADQARKAAAKAKGRPPGVEGAGRKKGRGGPPPEQSGRPPAGPSIGPPPRGA